MRSSQTTKTIHRTVDVMTKYILSRPNTFCQDHIHFVKTKYILSRQNSILLLTKLHFVTQNYILSHKITFCPHKITFCPHKITFCPHKITFCCGFYNFVNGIVFVHGMDLLITVSILSRWRCYAPTTNLRSLQWMWDQLTYARWARSL